MKKLDLLLLILILSIGSGVFWQLTQRNINFIYEALWDLVLTSDTNYTEEYSVNKFNQINIGMSENKVLELIGKPLAQFQPFKHSKNIEKSHFISLQYSQSISDTHYKVRQVYLNNGKVEKVVAYFYVD